MSIGDLSKKGLVAGAAFLAIVPALNLDKIRNVIDSMTVLVKTVSGKGDEGPGPGAIPGQGPGQAQTQVASAPSTPDTPPAQPVASQQPAPATEASASPTQTLTASAPAGAGAQTASTPAPPLPSTAASPAVPAVTANTAANADASMYRITTAEGLQNIARDLNGYFELAADIDATLTSQWNDGKGFQPIGTDERPFTGTLAGKGHSITGLTVNRSELDNVGLFGSTKGASIAGVRLERVNVSGSDNVGGLIGHSRETSVKHASAAGTVRGAESVGGLIGWQTGGSVDIAFTSGSVTGRTSAAGGLIGYTDAGATVDNTYSDADVRGADSVGGLIGWNLESTISRSYAAGVVRGTSDAAGLIGYDEVGTVASSFWDKDATRQPEGIVSGDDEDNPDLKASGLRTKQMQDPQAFRKLSGWNFDTIWRFVDSRGYPQLIMPDATSPVATSSAR